MLNLKDKNVLTPLETLVTAHWATTVWDWSNYILQNKENWATKFFKWNYKKKRATKGRESDPKFLCKKEQEMILREMMWSHIKNVHINKSWYWAWSGSKTRLSTKLSSGMRLDCTCVTCSSHTCLCDGLNKLRWNCDWNMDRQSSSPHINETKLLLRLWIENFELVKLC